MPPAPLLLLMLSPYDSHWLDSLSDLFPRIFVYLAVRAMVGKRLILPFPSFAEISSLVQNQSIFCLSIYSHCVLCRVVFHVGHKFVLFPKFYMLCNREMGI